MNNESLVMRRGQKNSISRGQKVDAQSKTESSAKVQSKKVEKEEPLQVYLTPGYEPRPPRITKNGKRKGRPPGSKTSARKKAIRKHTKNGKARLITPAELKQAHNGYNVMKHGSGIEVNLDGSQVDENVPEVEVEDYYADFDRIDKLEDERKHDLTGHRRPRFTKKMLQQVSMLSMLGATNEQIAIFFGKDMQTIDRWMSRYPEFREARQRGGMEADMKVAASVYMRATGFHYTEEELKYVNKEWLLFKVRKYSVPDTSAQQFWLKNRQRNNWADLRKVEHGGTVTQEHKRVEELDVKRLSEKAQKLLFEITKEQMTDGTRSN